MTNIVITTATIILTVAVPAGVMVTVEQGQQIVDGKPVEQINVFITAAPSPFPTPSATVSPSPNPSAPPIPAPSVSPILTPTPTPTPTREGTPATFQNIPQPTINDFSQVPQPQSMITDSKVPNAQPNAGTPTPAPSSLPIRNPQGSTFSLVLIN